MQSQDRLLTYGFALFSLITSFLFVFYAVNVNFSPDASEWLQTFAYVVGGYGLFNIYLLSWPGVVGSAGLQSQHDHWAMFFGIFTMDTFRDGIQDLTVELTSVIGLAAVLLLNWYAMKKVSTREKG